MLLAVDIGNSNMVLGVYRDRELVTHWRLLTEPQRTVDEYGALIALWPRPRESAPATSTPSSSRAWCRPWWA